MADLLASKAAMLREYFAIDIVAVASENEGEDADEAADTRKRARRSAQPDSAAGDHEAIDAMDDAEPHARRRPSAIRLVRLPRLVNGHTPQLPLLPDLVFSLAFEVDWAAEKACFHSLAQALGAFYARLPPVPRELTEAEADEMRREIATDAAAAAEAAAAGGAAASAARVIAGPGGTSLWRGELVTARSLEDHRADPASAFWQAAHVILPACRAALTPPAKLARSHHVVQLACTEQLYKIFERC